ncbi:MAG: TIGR01777 family oxidoreductase [Longimicrobiales bacterium]
MKIAITGSSGLIGSAVSDRLRGDGHTVTRVVRSREAAGADDALFWKPSTQELDVPALADHDAVINLAGENIFGLWTKARKRRIRESRVRGTRLLAETLAGLDDTDRPDVLINASAIGYYGDRPPDEPLTEDAEPADGFMARVVRDWEAATQPAADAGVRVVMTRFGLVLDPNGLLLQGMTLSTLLGLGAKLGDGQQAFPWVTRAEIAHVMAFLLAQEKDQTLSGSVNVVAPDKVTNEEFADTVARVLHRPRFLAIPKLALKLIGELGDEIAGGAWVVPAKLESAGYEWRNPALEPALRRLLDRPA